MNGTIDYYLIYSAMTETTSALIALVGIFLIFRIQIQRERLKDAYETLKLLIFPEASATVLKYPSYNQIDDTSRDILEKQKLSEDKTRKAAIKRERHTSQKHKKLLAHTIRIGIFILVSISMLCGFFIVALYLPFLHNVHTLMLSLFSSLIVLSFMVFFFVQMVIAAGWDVDN